VCGERETAKKRAQGDKRERALLSEKLRVFCNAVPPFFFIPYVISLVKIDEGLKTGCAQELRLSVFWGEHDVF